MIVLSERYELNWQEHNPTNGVEFTIVLGFKPKCCWCFGVSASCRSQAEISATLAVQI